MQVTPSALRYTLDHGIDDKPVLKGLDAWMHAGLGQVKRLTSPHKRLWQRALKIVALEKDYQDLTDAKLREAATDLHCCFRLHRDTPADLEKAFAVIREVANRQIGERPYPVQVMGALALLQGCIVEMATGEGKTLTATMPATVAGWRGRGCHVITVNDYLAQRDAEWMSRIYRMCGLHAAAIEQNMEAQARQAAYQADITYCTNKEVTADFLRDKILLGSIKHADTALQMRLFPTERTRWDRIVQRGLHFAIVDEADSVLIDEAVTPLIISGSSSNDEQVEAFKTASRIAQNLDEGSHYTVNHRYREIELTEAGKAACAQQSHAMTGFWSAPRRREELINKALVAHEFYRKDKHYVVLDDKVVIVDDFTGRLMPDRSWRDGLHQAIEAKEGLELTPVKETYARLSFQRFFRLYHRLAGMTGTAQEARREFWQVYHLPVVVIPPNKPCQRQDHAPLIVPTEEEKWQAIAQEVQQLHHQGRPILIGTRSVHATEHLSHMLTSLHLDHQVLNAVRHQEEANIVAEAGQPRRITVATNMAGRGTDIKLGRGVAETGGLHVICAERNDSGRIDRQLLGRCARQGDPGSTCMIMSMEDELIRRHGKSLAEIIQKVSPSTTNPKYSSLCNQGVFQIAQWRSQVQALQQRKNVMKTDHWLDEHLGFVSPY